MNIEIHDKNSTEILTLLKTWHDNTFLKPHDKVTQPELNFQLFTAWLGHYTRHYPTIKTLFVTHLPTKWQKNYSSSKILFTYNLSLISGFLEIHLFADHLYFNFLNNIEKKIILFYWENDETNSWITSH